MGILGKILAVLNVLAAAGFVYLAAVDWAERQSWAYATYRRELAVEGLPLTKDEWNPTENLKAVDRLSDYTLGQVFQGTGSGQPVATQRDEVQQVHDRLLAAIKGLPEDKAKDKLAANLLPLARRLDTREALSQRIHDGKIEALLAENGPFERVFQAVSRDKEIKVDVAADDKVEARVTDPFEWALQDIAPDKTHDGDSRDPAENRQVIAHLLFNLDPEDESPQRTLVVVGFKSYAEEGTSQARSLQEMAQRVSLTMFADRAAFETRYNQVIRDLGVLSKKLDARQADLTTQQVLYKTHGVLVEARKSDVDALTKDLQDARDATKTALAALAEEQQQLFKAQRLAGEGQAINEGLEQQIRKVEESKPGR